MSINSSRHIYRALRVGALAGLAGGFAEVGWIALYGALRGNPSAPVARAIVEAIAPAPITATVGLGLLVHLGLATALGLALVLALRLLARALHTAPREFAWVISALLAVWAVNFFVLLPRVSPGFVHLLPYAATLVSKLLFGVAAAAVFRANRGAWAISAHSAGYRRSPGLVGASHG
jgi:hypothetical protein